MDRESLSLWLEQGLSLEEIGRRVGRDPSTVSYWVQKHGLVAANRERHAPRGPLSRSQLEALVVAGATIAEIAETVERSKGTVRHWLHKYGLRTSPHRGARAQARRAASRDAGLAVAQHLCSRHGLTEFVLEGRGYYRCKRCRSDRVAERRRRIKATLVAEAVLRRLRV
jgi:transposase